MQQFLQGWSFSKLTVNYFNPISQGRFHPDHLSVKDYMWLILRPYITLGLEKTASPLPIGALLLSEEVLCKALQMNTEISTSEQLSFKIAR
jgi:hypothetical protein